MLARTVLLPTQLKHGSKRAVSFHTRDWTKLRGSGSSAHGRSTSLTCSATASWAVADGSGASALPGIPDSVEVRFSYHG